eukprot:4815077-Prymnesium_polylepis.1
MGRSRFDSIPAFNSLNVGLAWGFRTLWISNAPSPTVSLHGLPDCLPGCREPATCGLCADRNRYEFEPYRASAPPAPDPLCSRTTAAAVTATPPSAAGGSSA